MKVELPQQVDYIINELTKHGYEAYAVGGCVRDSILGKEPEDWDITTSAKPLEVKQIFRRTIDTGIQHGTVTVMLDKEGYEVTTYRVDGEYEDSRHPKTVEFTANLVEDLKRRDFTINAMAYNEQEGVVDVFNGLLDIQYGIIRCVGSASDRFDEDALRILRAVRFSAQLGFDIDSNTLQAAGEKAEKLNNISAERIRVELTKLLLSEHPEKLITAYEIGITAIILPEFTAMMKTEQRNSHHIYSVGIHTIKAVEAVGDNKMLRWAMLLHDVAKPICKSVGIDGEDHFYKHSGKGAEMTKKILRRLKFDNETIETVTRLVKWHDYRFTLTPANMRKAANKIGEDSMELLFEVKRADILAQNPATQDEKLTKLSKAIELYQCIQRKKECINLKMLEINGKDLLELGYRPGIKIGETLNKLLELVLENPELNEKEILLDKAMQYKDLR